MKKSIFVRILAALGGLTLWAFAGLAVAETFFHLPVTAFAGKVLGDRTPLMVLVTLVAAIVLFTMGLCCLLMLSGKRALRHRGYVVQKGENGMIGVSVKSIEGLVHTCVKQHEMIARTEISVQERRDGIVILLNVEEAAGVNIPLAVGALQKQIKQYVNSCTGVDVLEVRVMVDSTEDVLVGSPYVVEKPAALPNTAEAYVEAPAAAETAPAPAETEIPAEEAAEADVPAEEAESVQEAPAQEEELPQEAAVPVVMPVMPEMLDEEDDRPLHQRLFGAEEQPVFVPAPPELVIEPAAEEVAEETVEEESEEPAEDETPAEIDANAVLEVVEAIADEDVILEEVVPEEAAPEEDPAFEEAPEAVGEGEVPEAETEEIPAEEAAGENCAEPEDEIQA